MRVVQGGESLTALASGLQDALWRLGGCPQEHRTDSLSAAFKNLSREESQDMTTQYQELCRHYGMSATRNNRGQSHENGSVEGPHGHLKRRLKDALVLRGSRDFPSLEAYQEWIDTVVRRHNQRHQKLIEQEQRHLRPLPAFRTCDFKEVISQVTTSSTIVVQKVIYSVPSRLIGQQLRIHVYENRLSCYIGNDHVLDLPRLRTQQGKGLKRIDYRHLIGSLSRKPQAFRYSVLRQDLLPTPVYQEIWRQIDQKCTARYACKLMVGILKCAADYDCEKELGQTVLQMLYKGQIPSLGALQRQYEEPRQKRNFPCLSIPQHPLASYNQLLSSFRSAQEVSHA